MPRLIDARPEISVMLCKTISRKTIDGVNGVSSRYAGKQDMIDLTPFLNDNSSVVTSKSIREPAGGFSISFADKPQRQETASGVALETIYGLVEPMDMIEIRMWGGVGKRPSVLPIKMRGFVSEISRYQSVTSTGEPIRSVVVSGQDFGKIWQIYQILYLQAYVGGDALLTTYNMWELFGIAPTNTMAASDFVQSMVDKILNPFLDDFIPETSAMPKVLKTDLSVKMGVVNNAYQSEQGSIFDLLKLFGDVGIWNELYIEDRSDGVYVIYRPTPYRHVIAPSGSSSRLIQSDAVDPPQVIIEDIYITSLNESRSDNNVANFFWVNNQRFDMIDDTFRKTMSIQGSDNTVNLKDYANSSVKYYGIRPMMTETQQGSNDVKSMVSGLDANGQATRQEQFISWLDYRRKTLVEMNKDNVVLERGSVRVKGGMLRPADKQGKSECLKAGDYVTFRIGNIDHEAYVTQITDEFLPFRGYTATLNIERGTGFITRSRMESGVHSPWLAEQAQRF